MMAQSNLNFLNVSEVINDLPNKSGLYEIYNKKKKIIYIGISKNIKKRLKCHFADSSGKPSLTKQMCYVRYLLLDIEIAEKAPPRLTLFRKGLYPADLTAHFIMV